MHFSRSIRCNFLILCYLVRAINFRPQCIYALRVRFTLKSFAVKGLMTISEQRTYTDWPLLFHELQLCVLELNIFSASKLTSRTSNSDQCWLIFRTIVIVSPRSFKKRIEASFESIIFYKIDTRWNIQGSESSVPFSIYI